ncbi:MAG: PEP-CTERM sorting domain-containing protein [Cyanobacteria bacterium J06621_11]
MNLPNSKETNSRKRNIQCNNNKWFAIAAGVTITSLSVLSSTAAQAATYTLDFNSGANGGAVSYNSDGTLNTTQWSSWGLTNISGVNNRNGGTTAKLNTYNTNASDGPDPDLQTGSEWGTSQQGNALIIQEENQHNIDYFNNNGTWRADDEWAGGNINFDFAHTVAFNSFSLLDIDDNGSGIMLHGQKTDGSALSIDIDALMAKHLATNGTDAAASQGESVSLNGVTMTQVGSQRGDNSLFKFDISDVHLTQVRFSYPGSGAISDIEWDYRQPIPEPSSMIGLAMFGLLGAATKRKCKALT